MLKRCEEQNAREAEITKWLSRPGRHSLMQNYRLNNAKCVCTKTYKDGILQTIKYDFQKKWLSDEEYAKQFEKNNV